MHSHGRGRTVDHNPGDSRCEHIADAVMHGLGVVFAVAGTAALLTWAALAVPADRLWPLIPYGIGLVATFALSAAYNLTPHAPLRAVLRRFDHAAIYLMIAGTYTPMAIIGLGGGRGLALAVAAWGLAGVGIVMKLAWFHRWPRFGFALYLAQGWLGLVAIWPMIRTLPPAATALLLAGGLTYTAGTLFHLGRMRYATAIWHGHVLAAAVSHYAAVVLIAAA